MGSGAGQPTLHDSRAAAQGVGHRINLPGIMSDIGGKLGRRAEARQRMRKEDHKDKNGKDKEKKG